MSDVRESRREFLFEAAALVAAVAEASGRGFPSGVPRALRPAADDEILRQKFLLAGASQRPLTIGGAVRMIGTSFVGSPYGAHTLEQEGPERLVVNLRAFDCVTFVESTLAIARCVRSATESMDAFRRELQHLRYRGGAIDGYASRLHYFSDWVADNERKGIVTNIAKAIGGESFRKPLHFMTSHPLAYPRLADAAALAEMHSIEDRLSMREVAYIPLQAVPRAVEGIRSGDIIALTTSMEGLDVTHTGLAVDCDGILKYLHAPLTGGAVRVSERSLPDYLKGRTSVTGIIVARPEEPA